MPRPWTFLQEGWSWILAGELLVQSVFGFRSRYSSKFGFGHPEVGAEALRAAGDRGRGVARVFIYRLKNCHGSPGAFGSDLIEVGKNVVWCCIPRRPDFGAGRAETYRSNAATE